MTKYLNPLIFLSLFCLVFIFDAQKSISVQISSILPSGENKELIREFEKLNQHKQLYLYYEDNTPKALLTLKEIEKRLLNIEGINELTQNPQQKAFQERYFYFLNTIDHKKADEIDVKKELEKLYQKMVTSPFGFRIDQKDPLELYQKSNPAKKYTKLDTLGYITLLSLDKNINSSKDYNRIYNEIKKIEKEYTGLQTFSVIYYYVENANKIKTDTNKIIYLALGILSLLYLLILRDIKLLFHTFTSLASSLLFALLISSLIFDELSIFALIFAISISTVAIDYMFHNYMHGYYDDMNFFNRDVFFGMLSTTGAFFILSFSGFTLITQITIFAILSLMFSYLQFTFLFPKLKLKTPNKKFIFQSIQLNISPKLITLFALLFIFISFFNLQLDTNIKTLDVNNEKLNSLHQFFESKLLKDKKTAILLKEPSLDSLINSAHQIKKEYPTVFSPILSIPSKAQQNTLEKSRFTTLHQKINAYAKELGFRKEFFERSYFIENISLPDYTLISQEEFAISKYKQEYITYLIVSKKDYEEILKKQNTHSLSFKELFEQELTSSLKRLSILGVITFIFILFMIYLSVKEEFLKALNFILLPIAFTLCLTFFYPLNILHIFMMVVLISIGIDYGIYINSKSLDTQTYKAVLFSLLSTFAGFGVLIFSNITALFSIGITALMGIISLIILLMIQKGTR